MLFAGVTLTLFAYGGWQQALWVAGEVTSAPRTVPRAILLGVGDRRARVPDGELGLPRPAGIRRRPQREDAGGRRVSRWRRGAGPQDRGLRGGGLGVRRPQRAVPHRSAPDVGDGARWPVLRALRATPRALLDAGGRDRCCSERCASALTLGLGSRAPTCSPPAWWWWTPSFFALTGLALPILRRATPAQERGPKWIACGGGGVRRARAAGDRGLRARAQRARGGAHGPGVDRRRRHHMGDLLPPPARGRRGGGRS
jgi:hypothetical protein